MIGAHGDVIYKKGKGKFKMMKVKGRLVFKWTRPPQPDEPIDLQNVLRLPSKLCPPTHLKRTIRYIKRKRGEMYEKERFARSRQSERGIKEVI